MLLAQCHCFVGSCLFLCCGPLLIISVMSVYTGWASCSTFFCKVYVSGLYVCEGHWCMFYPVFQSTYLPYCPYKERHKIICFWVSCSCSLLSFLWCTNTSKATKLMWWCELSMLWRDGLSRRDSRWSFMLDVTRLFIHTYTWMMETNKRVVLMGRGCLLSLCENDISVT